MKLLLRINLIAALLTVSFAMNAQEVYEEVSVYQGTFLDLQITSNYGQPIPKSLPIEDNVLTLIDVNGNQYTYRYTPSTDFLGDDEFALEVIESFSPPTKVTYIFEISVITSMVEPKEDFIRISDLTDVSIFPLENDESSSENLEIKIAQVYKGNAVLGDSNSIIYTPEDLVKDYIVYSVVDEYGVSATSTIYLTPTYEVVESDLNIPSGRSEFIILQDSTFELVNDSLDLGTLEQVEDYVYKYTAFENIQGEEILNFENTDGNEQQVTIHVFERYEDLGYVRDDVVYTAKNTLITFDVSENDLNDQYVVIDHSSDLNHLGDGVFEYTPPTNFRGTKNFYYTADNGIEVQDGSIEVVVNNYDPVNSIAYNFNVAQNKPRVIEYKVPLGSEYFEIYGYPMHGDLDIYSDDQNVDLECIEDLQKVFVVYTPDDSYVGEDNFILRYCASDNNLCDDVLFDIDVKSTDDLGCICVDDCVWEGDANADGKVSILDALSVGRFLGLSGASRELSPYSGIYDGVDVVDWSEDQLDGTNAKHADTNGDGLITENDLQVILDNYGSINSVHGNDVFGGSGVPLYFTTSSTSIDSGELITIEINLGTQNSPAIDLNGFSFGININPVFIDSSSFTIEYYDDAFYTQNSPHLSLSNQVTDGVIHSAAVKTNNLSGSTGYGVVGVMNFIVEEDAEGLKDKDKSRSSSFDNFLRIKTSDVILEDYAGRRYRLPNSYLDIPFKTDESDSEISNSISVMPNPSYDNFNVQCSNGFIGGTLQVYDQLGKLKLSQFVDQVDLNVDGSSLDSGMYFIEVQKGSKTAVSKVVKI